MTAMSHLFVSKPPEIVESTEAERALARLCHDLTALLWNRQKRFDIQYISAVSLQIVYLSAVQGKIKAEGQIASPLW